MALSQRHLTLGLRLILLLATLYAWPRAYAQPVPTEPPPGQFRVLVSGSSGELSDLKYDLNGKAMSLYAQDTAISPLYQAPKDGVVEIFREIPPVPPETAFKRVSVAKVNLGTMKLALVVLRGSPGQGVGAMVFDDNWKDFPSDSVRILSLSRHKTAIQVEQASAQQLPPLSHKVFPLTTVKPRIRIKVASLDEDVWTMRFNNSQSVVPGLRVNMVISDFEPTSEDPNPQGLSVFKMIDSLKPPAPDSP